MIGFLVFGLLALTVICLWILIDRRKNTTFLFWFIPILLILVTSTYITYTSILGLPKISIPEKGLYLKHFIDEPDWIYIWVLGSDKIPRNYQIVYTRKTHKALEGVKEKSDEGKFMVLEKINTPEDGDSDQKGDKESAGGYTIGGDINIYEWDHENFMPTKD